MLLAAQQVCAQLLPCLCATKPGACIGVIPVVLEMAEGSGGRRRQRGGTPSCPSCMRPFVRAPRSHLVCQHINGAAGAVQRVKQRAERGCE